MQLGHWLQLQPIQIDRKTKSLIEKYINTWGHNNTTPRAYEKKNSQFTAEHENNDYPHSKC